LSKSEENIETSAKKWASALSDKTARAKAEEAARIILRHGIELPVIKESGRMKKRTLAQFRSDGTPTIEVNKKLNDDFWKRDARSVEIGWAAQDNPILHELGHYIDFICNKEKYNKQSENKRFFGETKSLIEKEVSIYAATDQWELEAELYAGIMRGKVYSNNVLNLSRISQSDNDIIKRLLSYGTGQDVCLPSEDISKQFKNMMKVLFQQEGSSFSINIMADKDVQKMIETHSSVLNGSFRQVEMSEAMRKRLERSNYVFSGLKTFHELNEAFPSLLDENGNRKTFERFLNDVRKIDETYNSNYLRAEFNFVQASAEMAAKWERFMQDGDRYYLQYRTAGDAKVRPTHAEMAGITLPASDPFWEDFYPPNGWGCRCSVVQVRKSKYPATDHEEAMARGESALELDKKGMFRFNAGMEQKTMPDYNPYTIKRCKDCDMNNGKMELVFVPENELCAACKLVRELAKADAKQTRAAAKPLQGTIIRNTHFHHDVNITGTSIREWTNQPHKHFKAKNQMLLDINNVFSNAAYLGTTDNHKGIKRVVQSHIFEVEVSGEKNLLIVREYDWGEYVLHSISDSPELYNKIKKE
jgi:SPP1 gp7 family putative phage head morphogenesis protein